MNLRNGIETRGVDFLLLVKLNVPFDDRGEVLRALQALEKVNRRKIDPERTHGLLYPADGSASVPQKVVGDLGLNLLVGFGLRFFCGPLEGRQPEEPVPNFPPGGVFTPRRPTRFGMQDRQVPLYLRTMNASGDKDWLSKRWAAEHGAPPSEQVLDAYYQTWLSNAESDLILLIECNNRYLVMDFWDAIRTEFVEPFQLTLVSLQDAFNRGDGRDHTGYLDGTSNLQDKMATDPLAYRSKIYLPHPAPAYPGEPDWSRDDPRYDGGTYMAHRKYLEHLDRWFSDDFTVTDTYGNRFQGHEARQHAIGRDQNTGCVLNRSNGKLLKKEPDSAEINLGYNEAHALKARGGVTAPFAGPFPPLEPGQTNVFNTQDIRIRRRGTHYAELDLRTGHLEYGLHFICYQNNIQQTGFEFINNIWLLNPLFRRSHDGLFNPDAGVIEPLEGCYYFVPPEHREFPGEVFFQ